MSPEERLQANDNAARAILEMREPTSTRKSTVTDLSALLEGLIEADVKFILVGGLAAVV